MTDTQRGWTVHLTVDGATHAEIMAKVLERLEQFWPSALTEGWHLSADVRPTTHRLTGNVETDLREKAQGAEAYRAEVAALRMTLPPEKAVDDEGDDDGEVPRLRRGHALGSPPVEREGGAAGP